MLRILYDDFDQKVKNIHHDEMKIDLHHSYKKKACIVGTYNTTKPLREAKGPLITAS